MSDIATKKTQESETDFELKVSSDKMGVMLSCVGTIAARESITAEIMDRLNKTGIKLKPKPEELTEKIKCALEEGNDIRELLILSGEEPDMPTDGRIEWTGDYFSEGYYVDPKTGLIDFKRKICDPSVEEGVLLAVIHKGKPGKDGCNVLGHAIKVPRPKDVSLRAGTGVVWSPEDNGFRAAINGRVKLSGNMVSVEDILYVHNGVGAHSGNISHNGPVTVDGDVENEFKVEASGDIEVKGVLLGSDVICGGNLTVVDGINGNIAKKIEVKGNILTKYILNSTIICEGSISANKEIFHSNINVRGEITCTEGRFVGGKVYAAKGFTLGEVGGEGMIKTFIVAGIDYAKLAAVKKCEQGLEQLKSIIKQLNPASAKLKANQMALNNAQKEVLTEITFKIQEANDQLESLEEEKQQIHKEMIADRRAKIKILGIVHPGVILRIGDSQYEVNESLRGPLMAMIDNTTGDIMLTSELDTITESRDEG